MSSREDLIVKLVDRSRSLNIALPDKLAGNLLEFLFALKEFDQHTNLVADSQLGTLIDEHVVDSMTLIAFLQRIIQDEKLTSVRLADIGSGAGFPGIVLGLFLSEIKVSLIDSSSKKSGFLKDVVHQLHLEERISVITGRCEDLAHQNAFRDCFHFVTARAVGTIACVSELGLPLLRIGGHLLLQKSIRMNDELTEARETLSVLGGKLVGTHRLFHPLDKERWLVMLRKEKQTPLQYPRSWAKIKNNRITQSR